MVMRSCNFPPNLSPLGCLFDDDERSYSRFLCFSHFLEPKATHERGGAVLCSFRRRLYRFSASVLFW
jgi:hypothetical protein